jgi:N-acetylglucosamine-6-phosphate deacetylase
MTMALVNGRVLLDGGFVERQAVIVEQGRIAAIIGDAEIPSSASRRDLGGAMLLPGFIDTQVNGGGGVLFNDEPTVEGIAAIGAAHRKFGTTGFLPTLISDDLGKVDIAMKAADAAIEQGLPGVLGIHVEGPFLTLKRKGIHDAAKIRLIDAEGVKLLSSPGRGRTVATLAPEKVKPAMIRQLADSGVIVSAGHTNATFEITSEALAHGLTGFTHLFNAMSQLGSREPGVVGAALLDTSSWCGIIVDGRHVDPAVLRIALRCAPMHRFMLVTDAMPSVGAADKSFMLQGRAITVQNGVCMDEDGTLAGSDLDMASAVRNAVQLVGLDLVHAVQMASRNPAAFLGLGHELGRIAPGYRASLVLADDDLNILDSWIDGEPLQPTNS